MISRIIKSRVVKSKNNKRNNGIDFMIVLLLYICKIVINLRYYKNSVEYRKNQSKFGNFSRTFLMFICLLDQHTKAMVF